MRVPTSEQIQNIQVDYGLVFANYGEAGQVQLGPTKGGAEFTASKIIRDIEYDGRKGKTKGAQVIDEINAMLKVGLMDTSLELIGQLMPHASFSEATGKISNDPGGVIEATKYLANVTLFAKVVGGGYKKITLFNAMNEADFVLSAAPKAEGVVNYEFHAHWDAEDPDALFEIEDIESISDDTTKPTVTTTPADAATDVLVSADLTAEFSEAIRSGDIIGDNFLLIKASDGSIVAGTLTYSSATKTATFDPTSNLTAGTAYIWTISRVRDRAGNVMDPVVANFTTA